MGICLVVGFVLFAVSLTKLIIVAIHLRKVKDVIIPYIRMLLFIFVFFLVFTLFCAYVINNAANEGTISSGYESYYQCLSGATPTPVDQCQLSSDVSNYSLVMLKGFALSCLGLLLFFTFLSWQLFYHWYKIFRALFRIVYRRDKASLMKFVYLVGTDSVLASSSQTLAGASTLTMSAEHNDEISKDEDAEGEELKEEKGEDNESSSSSE